MNYYVVTVQVQVSGYEKHIRQLVLADSYEQAEQFALLGEAHNDLEPHDCGDVYTDDIFWYTVVDVQEVKTEHASILKEYL